MDEGELLARETCVREEVSWGGMHVNGEATNRSRECRSEAGGEQVREELEAGKGEGERTVHSFILLPTSE